MSDTGPAETKPVSVMVSTSQLKALWHRIKRLFR